MKKVLAIAGSDCSGGAGIQADLKTFSAHGVYGMSVITSVVAENTCKVISIHNVPVKNIEEQLDAVFTDIEPDAVKVGMLPNASVMSAVARKLKEYQVKRAVIDPVMAAKGGCALMQPQAHETLVKKIIPISYLLTPNIPEAEEMLHCTLKTIEDMKEACKKIQKLGAENVLVKGGHFEGEPVDVLYDGTEFYQFRGKRVESENTHGTGCTLSSAITANLANGLSLTAAVEQAKKYVTNAILYTTPIGHGHGPVNHFYQYVQKQEE